MNAQPILCQFNMDTSCVEALYPDHSKLSIDCDLIEEMYAHNIYERSELDYLIYNSPEEYINLILSGDLAEYLRKYTDYSPLD